MRTNRKLKEGQRAIRKRPIDADRLDDGGGIRHRQTRTAVPAKEHKLMPTSIQLLSDLHLETDEYEAALIQPASDIIAVLGDIGPSNHPNFPEFLRKLARQFRLVLFVLGNNEFHYSSYVRAYGFIQLYSNSRHRCCIQAETIQRVESIVAQHYSQRATDPSLGELILLNRTRIDLSPTLTVLGATLWSNLTDDANKLAQITSSVGDFLHIDGFTQSTTRILHARDHAWLKAQVAYLRAHEPQREVLILTHHAPTLAGTARPDLIGGVRESAYATEFVGTECWGAPITVWAFGHTHWSCDFERDGVRVVSNQRGRRSSKGARFDPSFVLQV
jgi:predicted phosphodiesterase